MTEAWRDKTVIVTGASSGLGLAIADAFGSVGANVVLVARGADALEAAADRLAVKGQRVLAAPADITRPDDVDRVVRETLDRYGRLDALVNNAGRSARQAIADTKAEDFQQLLELNLLGTVRMTRAALPHLLQAQGHVVNIGSLAGKLATRYLGAYPASKFALVAYTQQLRIELAPQGLHVLLVCPGPIARDKPRPVEPPPPGVPAAALKPAGGAKTRAVRPERIALDIVRACERRQAELVYPPIARLLFALTQLSPRLGDWVLKRMT